MISSFSCRCALAALLPFVAAITTSAPAQQPDVNAMVKWMSAAVIHYRYVGEYAGEVQIMGTGPGGGAMAKVADRVEFELDWHQKEARLVGTPVLKNYPTRSDLVPDTRLGCPAPRIQGAFEFSTATSVAPKSPGIAWVTLAMKRDLVGGAVAYAGDDCAVRNYEAKSDTLSKDLALPPGLLMARPGGPKTPDGKSLIQKDSDGWVWTITPTIK